MEFDWIEFYEELADKLLAYRNNRVDLLMKFKRAHAKAGVHFLENGKNCEVVDIDPFSVFALISRRIQRHAELLSQLRAGFGLKADVPKDFSGIPLTDSRRAFLFYGCPDRPSDIEGLWQMFEVAVQFAKGGCGKSVFCRTYSEVVKQKGVMRLLTMGLFWTRPRYYLSLDGSNTGYIFGSGFFPADFVGKYRHLKNGCANGDVYWKFCEAVKRTFGSKKTAGFNDFPRLSWAAYLWAIEKKIHNNVNAKVSDKDIEAVHDAYEARLARMTETERKVEVHQRIGQDILRKELLMRRHACAVTHIKRPELLVASHIKGWAECPVDRMCLDNVLLLAKNYDAVFDRHLISFDPITGNIIKAKRISWEQLGLMGIRQDAQISKPTTKQAECLEWHCKKMYKLDIGKK